MSLAPGARIGSHVVLSLLGEGGMGEVYRARDTALDREVAIKRLPEAVANDPDRLARFEREARALAALNHPNVAQIYAVEAGAIVMELVPGETLRGPLPLDRALDYAAQIASALDAAHEKGLVHRDLKPGNVMVTPDGVIKVLDFGLAGRESTAVHRAANDSTTHAGSVSSAGLILGTAAYMAPEQASGKPVDKRADIFAFGVVLWEMLTGRRLFEGDTITEVLASVLTREPDLTAAPPRVRRLLARCLEKDPRKRLRDIGDAMSLVDPVAPAASDGAVSVAARSPLQQALSLGGWATAGALGIALAVTAWPWPAPDDGNGPPVVRFQIPRASDTYSRAVTAFAISPDGGTLAHYDATADGRHALFVRTLSTGEIREVPNTRLFNPMGHSIFWSPDGRQIVRGDVDRTDVIDVATGGRRRLCDCRFNGGTWNRDGVILLGGSNLTAEGIRRLSLDDGSPVAITRVDASSRERDEWPVFLPDGRRFLFTRTAPGGRVATYLGSLDGMAPARLVEGSRRLFVASEQGRSGHLLGIDAVGLVAQPFDADRGTVTGPAVPLVPEAVAVSGAHGVLATSAAGTRLRSVPTWFDRKGTPQGTEGESGFFESLALSDDSRRLAIGRGGGGSGRGGGAGDIWVRGLSTGVSTRVTFNAGGDSSAIWSPDGTRIAYSSMQQGEWRLYQRAADGTGVETPIVPYDQPAWPNDWSNDGRWLIYSTTKPETVDNDLWFVPMNGATAGTPAQYLTTRAREKQAQFSPDGRFVAYASDESGTFEIYVQPFPDASQGKWMVSSGGGVEPRWSRDGKALLYFSGQTLLSVPVSVVPPFSPGAPVALFEAAIQAGYSNDSQRWQLTPDGRRFLLLIPDGQQQASPLEVIVNWSGLLKQ